VQFLDCKVAPRNEEGPDALRTRAFFH